MSQHGKEGLMSCLFSGQDANIANVKFLRGSADQIDAHDLSAQAHSAVIQKKTGAATRATGAPKSQQPAVNVRAFVAKM